MKPSNRQLLWQLLILVVAVLMSSVGACAADTTPPTLRIDLPLDGSIHTTAETITVLATANDASDIDRVTLHFDLTYLGPDEVPPYTCPLPLADVTIGSHTVKVTAYDNAGNYTIASVTIYVVVPDVTPPILTIESPEDGAVFSSDVIETTILATADDPQSDVDSVTLYIDGGYMGPDKTAPWTCSLPIKDNLSLGEHTITLVAFNGARLSTTDFVTIHVVEATGTEQPEGFHDGIDGFTTWGWAYDPDSPSESVLIHLYMDGPALSGVLFASLRTDVYRPDVNKAKDITGNHGFSYTIPDDIINTLPAGEHEIYAYAIDYEGVQGNNVLLNRSPHSFVIASGDITPPTVSITSPADGATLVSTESVKIIAEADDANGIDKVELYIDNDYIGKDVSEPYECDWKLRDWPLGSHLVKVIAYDNAGNTASDEITATIIEATGTEKPVGFHDGIDGFTTWGWAYDPDCPSSSLLIHLYMDGPAGSGVLFAWPFTDVYRPDVNEAKNITGDHGFRYTIPSEILDALPAGEHEIYAYAIDYEGVQGNNVLLRRSPHSFVVGGGAYSISGSVGVDGATITAGNRSVVSDADGNYSIDNLSPGTYRVTPSKSGCSFTPSFWDITIVSENWEDVNFATPCGNDFTDDGDDCFATDYAADFLEGYMMKRSYVLDRWYKKPAVNASSNEKLEAGIPFGCTAYECGYTPTCRPDLPLYKFEGTYSAEFGFFDCYGFGEPFLDKSEEYRHWFPQYFPESYDSPGMPGFATYVGGGPHYTVSWCGIGLIPCEGWRCDPVGELCAQWIYQDRLRIVDPVAGEYPKEANLWSCAEDDFDFYPYSIGPDFRHVYPHEVTPDEWGMLPGDEYDTPGKGVLLVPDGHNIPAGPVLGENLTKGNAFVEFRFLEIVYTDLTDKSCIENDFGDACSGYYSSSDFGDYGTVQPTSQTIPMGCDEITDRARAFDYDGDGVWDEIFITGYGTGDNILQNYFDNQTAVANLKGRGSFSNNVEEVIGFIYRAVMNHELNLDNFWLRGHSLGGQEVVLIAREMDPGMIDRVTTYGIAVNTPPSAMAPIDGITTEHFVDPHDYPLSTNIVVEAMRILAGAPIHWVDNATGHSSSLHTHYRILYQQNAEALTGTPHPAR